MKFSLGAHCIDCLLKIQGHWVHREDCKVVFFLGTQASCLHLGPQASSLQGAGRMPAVPGTLHFFCPNAPCPMPFENVSASFFHDSYSPLSPRDLVGVVVNMEIRYAPLVCVPFGPETIPSFGTSALDTENVCS